MNKKTVEFNKTRLANMSEKEFKKPLVIQLSKWLRSTLGSKNAESVLLQESGEHKMCCMGFYCKNLGLKGLGGILFPGDLLNEKDMLVTDSEFPTVGVLSRDDQYQLSGINDSDYTTDEEKMKSIESYFAKLGVKVKFVP